MKPAARHPAGANVHQLVILDVARRRHGVGELPELPHPASSKRARPPSPDLGKGVNTAASLGAGFATRTATAAASRQGASYGRRTTTTRVVITASNGDSGLRRGGPRRVQRAPRGRRHVPFDGEQRARLDRDGVERQRQRLQQVHREAVVAKGHGLLEAHDRRRRVRRRTRTRVWPCTTATAVGMAGLRRHERRVARDRGDLRAQRHDGEQRVDDVQPHLVAVRRHERLERTLLARVRAPAKSATTARRGTAHQRHRRVLIRLV